MEGHKPVWGPLGTRSIDWKGQIAALLKDGYTGWLSLETHWPGPEGDKMRAAPSAGGICAGWRLGSGSLPDSSNVFLQGGAVP